MDKKAIWIFATCWYIWKQQQNKSAEDILEVYKSCREIFFYSAYCKKVNDVW